METQQYYYNIDYDKERDWWFENHVYPSQNGVSAIIGAHGKNKGRDPARNFRKQKTRYCALHSMQIVGTEGTGK